MTKLFNGGINARGLRKSFNNLIEKYDVNFCTLTEEEVYDIGSLKRVVEVVRDTIAPLEEGREKDRGALLLETMKQHILNLEYGITKAPKHSHLFKVKTVIATFCALSALFCTSVMLIYGFDVVACIDVVLSVFLAICAGIGAREEAR